MALSHRASPLESTVNELAEGCTVALPRHGPRPYIHHFTGRQLQWRQGDFLKPELLDPSTVDEDVLREVAAACPTSAIVLEQVMASPDG